MARLIVLVTGVLRISRRLCEPTATEQDLHVYTTEPVAMLPAGATSFAVGRTHWSHPYLFAFGGRDGSVTIWSIQSNSNVRLTGEVQLFEVLDLAGITHHVVSIGRRLTIPPPDTSVLVQSHHRGDEDAT